MASTNPYEPASQPHGIDPRAAQQVPSYDGTVADRASREAALDAMHRKADRQAGVLRWAPFGALLVFLALRARNLRGAEAVAGGATLVALLLVAWVVVALARRRIGERHRAVVAARPGAEVIEVWGASGFLDALGAAGATGAKGRRSAATALSMVLSAQGIELWTGRASSASVLVTIPWTAVVAVDESRGSTTDYGSRPAIMLVTTLGQRLLLVPRRRTDGGRAVRVPQLRSTVARLQDLRARALRR